MAEPLLLSDEYWRVEMGKVTVRVFRLCPRAAKREGERWPSLRAGLRPDQSPALIIVCRLLSQWHHHPPVWSRKSEPAYLLSSSSLPVTPIHLAHWSLHILPLSIPVLAQVLTSFTRTNTPAGSLDALSKGCSTWTTRRIFLK